MGAKKKDRGDLHDRLVKYIDETDIPIVAEFAYQNKINRSQLYELYPDTIKMLIDKKEAQLERGGLDKKIDKTMAIFSLKQLGWKDVQEMNVGFNATEISQKFAEMVSTAGTGRATQGNK